jgi:hypothetical protein
MKSREFLRNVVRKNRREGWNNGILEHWVDKNILDSFHIIPPFHHSIIPESSFGGIE